MAKIKQEKLAVDIQRYISEIIQFELKHVDLGLVTVTKVTVSPDLKYCTVWFMTTNGNYLQEVLGGLQLAANFFRKQVATKTSLRYVPEINFRVDKTFEAVDEIEKLLRDPHVAQDLK